MTWQTRCAVLHKLVQVLRFKQLAALATSNLKFVVPSENLYHNKNEQTLSSCLGSLAVSELETTVRRLAALETSAATVQGATLEAMEETVALVEVRK